MRPTWKWLREVGTKEVAAVFRALPADVKRRAEAIPIVFERRPSRALRVDGIEADTLGLFLGPSALDEPGVSPLPPQIILFLENIRDASGADERRAASGLKGPRLPRSSVTNCCDKLLASLLDDMI
ncbi:MAG: hypothetical protein HYV36_02445 [Lentisphaerae bacterium]|nr:hypothetical protein [Lentisphaerota bacterium]